MHLKKMKKQDILVQFQTIQTRNIAKSEIQMQQMERV